MPDDSTLHTREINISGQNQNLGCYDTNQTRCYAIKEEYWKRKKRRFWMKSEVRQTYMYSLQHKNVVKTEKGTVGTTYRQNGREHDSKNSKDQQGRDLNTLENRLATQPNKNMQKIVINDDIYINNINFLHARI